MEKERREVEGDEPDALYTNTAQDTTPKAPPALTFGPGFPVLPLGPLSPRGPLERHKKVTFEAFLLLPQAPELRGVSRSSQQHQGVTGKI